MQSNTNLISEVFEIKKAITNVHAWSDEEGTIKALDALLMEYMIHVDHELEKRQSFYAHIESVKGIVKAFHSTKKRLENVSELVLGNTKSDS